MAKTVLPDFREVLPAVHIGTASDRYAGWIGTVYTPGRWEKQAKTRSKSLGGRTYEEKVLPVESAEEYFGHFPMLEIDFTFYRPLLEKGGTRGTNAFLLERYAKAAGGKGRFLLKAPGSVLVAPGENRKQAAGSIGFLDAADLEERFCRPARDILGDSLAGIVLEQAYQRSAGRMPPSEFAEKLDGFFGMLPREEFHLEVRTKAYLGGEIAAVQRKHGVGGVLSHWRWLPSLAEQAGLTGGGIPSRKGVQVVRLMTPRGKGYEESYELAHPFDRMIPGMMSRNMLEETAELCRDFAAKKRETYVIVNNRSGGSAPLIASSLVERLRAVGLGRA